MRGKRFGSAFLRRPRVATGSSGSEYQVMKWYANVKTTI
jgi:hypothetical protein